MYLYSYSEEDLENENINLDSLENRVNELEKEIVNEEFILAREELEHGPGSP